MKHKTKTVRRRAHGAAPSASLGVGMVLAALALPLGNLAQAEAQPEYGQIAFKYLGYQDSQPGQDRIKVTTPAFSLMTPVGEQWSVAGNVVVDSISGASPAYHTQALTSMVDERRAIDVALTRYFDEGTFSLGANFSQESDYVSRGLTLGGTYASEDKNTTWIAGLNLSHDSINPSNHITADETKDTQEISLGVTQVLTQRDIMQAIAGFSHGVGYYSDPYKIFDKRPNQRDHTTFLLRWNHHIDATGGTSRLSYRYYKDSFDILAHTLTAEYVQPLPDGWTLTPQMRLYSQGAARFYVDFNPDWAPFPANPPPGAQYYTEDQRLSAYGARSVGIKVAKQLGEGWQIDLKYDSYTQKAEYKFGGDGSPYLDPMTIVSYQFGVSKRF